MCAEGHSTLLLRWVAQVSEEMAFLTAGTHDKKGQCI